jgi:hypothetical protein
MRILPLLLLAMLVLFLAGLIVPRKSRRMQRWTNDRLQVAKEKGDRRAGFVGDWTAKSLDWGQTLVTKAAEAGRRLRARLESGLARMREKLAG